MRGSDLPANKEQLRFLAVIRQRIRPVAEKVGNRCTDASVWSAEVPLATLGFVGNRIEFCLYVFSLLAALNWGYGFVESNTNASRIVGSDLPGFRLGYGVVVR